MRPVSLKLKGLNSFEDEVNIDFEALSSNGIFGIFGPTGSGKSTILDAMTLALYGETARKSTNFIHLSKDRMYVEYVFSMEERGEHVFYTVRREYKRNKQGGIVTSLATVTRTLDGMSEMIAEKKTETDRCCYEILGLKFDDFIRTVILPQGQFSEFLKLKGTERRDMLERLFHLEEYGVVLQDKLRKEKGKLELVLAELSGRLTSLGETGEALQKEKEEELRKLTAEKETNQKRRETLQEILERQKEVLSLWEEYVRNKQAYEEIRKQKASIQEYGEILEAANRAERIMPYLLNFEKNSKTLDVRQREYEQIVRQAEDIRRQQEEVQIQYQKAQDAYVNQLPKLQEQKQTVEHIILADREIVKLQKECFNLEKELQENEKIRQNREKEAEQLQAEIEGKEKETARLYETIISAFEERENITPEEKFRKSVAYIRRYRDLSKPCPVCGGNCTSQMSVEENIPEGEEQEYDTLIQEIQKNQKKAEKKKQEAEQLRKKWNKCQQELEELRSICVEREKEKTGIVKLLEEKKKEREQNMPEDFWKQEFPQCQSYEMIQEVLEKTIEDIIRAYDKLNLEKERVQKECTQKELLQKEQQGMLASLKETVREAEESLNSILQKQNTDITAVRSAYLNQDKRRQLEQEISSYGEREAKAKGAFDTVSEKLEGRMLKNFQWEQEKKRYEENLMEEREIRENLERMTEHLAEIRQELVRMKEQETMRKTLEKKEKECMHRKALLAELESLCKGKKFVEYAAHYRLHYITKEASARLKQITAGNYELVLDENSQFAIRDLKCGGELRDASTLSGGETFMASLALALALSSEIQLKGKAPLELFFMDEGFGSLDEELLDVVMNSLEQIHHERLKIGVISHVEMIQNRISKKLFVIPGRAGEGGSRVVLDK